MFLRTATAKSMNACYDKKSRLKQELETADAVVIGAGAGLSTSAGFTYTGERFQKYFADFIAKYGFLGYRKNVNTSGDSFGLMLTSEDLSIGFHYNF